MATRSKGFQTVIDKYEKLHPNVTITQTPVTNDAKILASIVGGDPPDIVDLGTSLEIGAWASQGAIEPLGSMISADHLNLGVFNQTALDGMKVNGQLYALPFMSSTRHCSTTRSCLRPRV